jgi:tungstate transport system permease protein
LLAVVLLLNVLIALLRRWRERVDGAASDLPVGVAA